MGWVVKFRFTPENFSLCELNRIMADRTYMGIDHIYTADSMARFANVVLDEHLKTLPMVYGPSSAFQNWNTHPGSRDTHQALLFDIEELKPKQCEHEPVSEVWLDKVYPNYIHFTKCSKCGAKLKAKWEVEK